MFERTGVRRREMCRANHAVADGHDASAGPRADGHDAPARPRTERLHAAPRSGADRYDADAGPRAAMSSGPRDLYRELRMLRLPEWS
jgi:hypothetical protein